MERNGVFVSTEMLTKALEARTRKEGDHLILCNKNHRIGIMKRYFSAPQVQFFLKHGREVPPHVKLMKMVECEVKNCIEHYYEGVELGKRYRETESDDSLPPSKKRKITEWNSEQKQQILKRLQSKVKAVDPPSHVEGKCMLWQDHTTEDGYGKVSVQGRVYSAHRLAYELYTETELSQNDQVRHLCGNRSCIAKEHLAIGDAKDNAQDKILTGSYSKISKEVALAIYQSANLSDMDCARKFNVGQKTVWNIRHGRSWSHVTGATRSYRVPNRKIPLKPEDEEEAKKYIEGRVEKVTIDGQEHWLWHGCKYPHGYGKCNFHGITYAVHILSYRAFKHQCAPIPEHLRVLHGCKHKNCVNPAELRLGTLQENSADRIRDGTDARGEKGSNTILTEKDVMEIIALRPCMTQSERAKKYGVSTGTITSIDLGKTWKHIPRPSSDE